MSDKAKCKNTIKIDKLKKLIDTKTREEIAKGIGCNTSLVTRHYNEDRTVTLEYVVKYAEYFKVSTDYLLGLTDTKSTDPEIQAVCDYTGLSEDAVRCLHQYLTHETAAFDHVCFNILNDLLEEGSPLYEVINNAAINRRIAQSSISQMGNFTTILSETSGDDLTDNPAFIAKEKEFMRKMYYSFSRSGINLKYMYYQTREIFEEITKAMFCQNSEYDKALQKLENAFANKYGTSVLFEEEGEPHADD